MDITAASRANQRGQCHRPRRSRFTGAKWTDGGPVGRNGDLSPESTYDQHDDNGAEVFFSNCRSELQCGNRKLMVMIGRFL